MIYVVEIELAIKYYGCEIIKPLFCPINVFLTLKIFINILYKQSV